MEIIQIGSDKGENDNAVIPSEGWDNTPLFYMGLVGHSKTNLETRILDFCLMGVKYFLH